MVGVLRYQILEIAGPAEAVQGSQRIPSGSSSAARVHGACLFYLFILLPRPARAVQHVPHQPGPDTGVLHSVAVSDSSSPTTGTPARMRITAWDYTDSTINHCVFIGTESSTPTAQVHRRYL